MPRVVDHQLRRDHVAEVAAQLIAEGGLDRVTFRDIAEAAGCSTAIVSHYFADKRDVLHFTYRAAATSASQRLHAAWAAHPGDLSGCLEALLPIDEARLRDWRVWCAFWGTAIADPDLRAEQRHNVNEARADLAEILRRLVGDGQLPAHVDIDREARSLLTLIMGIAAQAVFDPDDWPARRQRSLVREHLHRNLPELTDR